MDETIYTATVDALESELARTVRLAELTDPQLPIPSCPGWDAAALWKHLGMVHRWAAEIVRTRSDVPLDRAGIDMQLPDDDQWAPWLAEGADLLLAALRDCAVDQPMWTWGEGRSAGWWARRQLHETLVHDADAALALGEELGIEPERAADCIDERLENLAASLFWRGEGGQPQRAMTVHLHATDDGIDEAGEWMVSVVPPQSGAGADDPASRSRIVSEHAHGKGDAAVRGPATALLMSLFGRYPADHGELQVFGDESAWEEFREIAALG